MQAVDIFRCHGILTGEQFRINLSELNKKRSKKHCDKPKSAFKLIKRF